MIFKCKNCLDKDAKYYEFSPDGKTDYFCSLECNIKYARKMASKGLFWRASPLVKIK